jgi:hypothetical protein
MVALLTDHGPAIGLMLVVEHEVVEGGHHRILTVLGDPHRGPRECQEVPLVGPVLLAPSGFIGATVELPHHAVRRFVEHSHQRPELQGQTLPRRPDLDPVQGNLDARAPAASDHARNLAHVPASPGAICGP